MFGMVTANIAELTEAQRRRYRSLYCGICHQLGNRASQASRLCLTYDMVFLALVLTSLYEPEESHGAGRCLPHPLSRQAFTTSSLVDYAADMNLALGYFSADDHWKDDKRPDALALKKVLKKHYPALVLQYPRQCQAMEENLALLHELEQNRCPNPDLPANAFGQLLGELFVFQEDHWSPYLRRLGHSLGRFIYLADAIMDYESDRKKHNYNPFLAAVTAPDPGVWEQILMGEMAACTEAYEHLPLIEDKELMDNILFSGIWQTFRRKEKKGSGKTYAHR